MKNGFHAWNGRKMANSVLFNAIVYKVQTLIDGGIRVTLDLEENAISQAASLMQAKIDNLLLRVEIKEYKEVNNDN